MAQHQQLQEIWIREGILSFVGMDNHNQQFCVMPFGEFAQAARGAEFKVGDFNFSWSNEQKRWLVKSEKEEVGIKLEMPSFNLLYRYVVEFQKGNKPPRTAKLKFERDCTSCGGVQASKKDGSTILRRTEP